MYWCRKISLQYHISRDCESTNNQKWFLESSMETRISAQTQIKFIDSTTPSIIVTSSYRTALRHELISMVHKNFQTSLGTFLSILYQHVSAEYFTVFWLTLLPRILSILALCFPASLRVIIEEECRKHFAFRIHSAR